MRTLWQDLRFALRLWRRLPATTLAALACLALGIGANSGVFSLVYGVLLQPLPYSEPGQLYIVGESKGPYTFPLSFPNFLDYRSRNRSFADLAVFSETPMTWLADDQPRRLAGCRVSANLFKVLGRQAALGRTLSEEDDQPQAEPAALLSHSFWQQRLGGDPAALGSVLRLDQLQATVVGVMPEGFAFPSPDTQFWLPLRGDSNRLERDFRFLNGLGRLRSEVQPEDALRDLSTLAAALRQDHPEANRDMGATLRPLKEFLTGSGDRLWLLMGTVFFVLLIGCVNVASLLLARIQDRRPELAVRRALGASSGRLLRQTLVESLLLGLAGGALGLALAPAVSRTILALSPDGIPRSGEVGLHPPVILFCLAASLLTVMIFGSFALWSPLPSWNRSQPFQRLRGRGRQLALDGLVVAEAALCLLLLVGAGLSLHSFARLSQVESGFEERETLAFRVTASQSRYPDPTSRIGFFEAVQAEVASLPGVEQVGATFSLPLSPHNASGTYWIPEDPPAPGSEPQADRPAVTASYFSALGVPLLEGRMFGDGDDSEAPRVVIVNRALARRHWPIGQAAGRTIRFGRVDEGSSSATVIGVVEDVRQRGLDQPPQPMIYSSLRQSAWFDSMAYVVRSPHDPQLLLPAIAKRVAGVDPQTPVTETASMRQVVSRALAPPRFQMALLGSFAAVAFLLSTVGIYGVVWHRVNRRRLEMGIRSALGADRQALVRMVLRQGGGLLVAGAAIGAIAAGILAPLLTAKLYGVAPLDPISFAGSALLLLATGLLACWLPARKVTREDPVRALRFE